LCHVLGTNTKGKSWENAKDQIELSWYYYGFSLSVCIKIMTQLDLIFCTLSGFSLSVCIKIMTQLDLICCTLSGFSLSVCIKTMTQLHLIFCFLSWFSHNVCNNIMTTRSDLSHSLRILPWCLFLNMTKLDLIFRILSGFSLSVCIKIMTQKIRSYCVVICYRHWGKILREYERSDWVVSWFSYRH
jgi:hypothetical protein